MSRIRFERLFNRDERCVIVAMDHCEFDGPIPGMVNLTETAAKVYACARIIAELGADLIKTFYTNRFKAVTESCPVPVLGLGAAKTPTQLQALQLAADEVRDGAGGVVFGRNAIQVPDPAAFQRALCDVVKRGLTPATAVKKHGLKD